MSPFGSVALAAAATIAAFADVTSAHDFVIKPLAEWRAGTTGYGNWVDQFSPPWKGDVSTGAKFTAIAKANGYTTTRQFLEKRGPDCGFSNPNAKAKAIPSDRKVTFARALGHPGPCELWIGDKMVYHNDDCMVALGSAVSVPIDWSSCKSTCQLRFYWLGLQNHGQLMQSYKNCIPVTAGSSRSMDEVTESFSFSDLNSTRN